MRRFWGIKIFAQIIAQKFEEEKAKKAMNPTSNEVVFHAISSNERLGPIFV